MVPQLKAIYSLPDRVTDRQTDGEAGRYDLSAVSQPVRQRWKAATLTAGMPVPLKQGLILV